MTIKLIDAKTLKKWLDNKEAIVIDVREPYEYAESYIKGSHLISLAGVNEKAIEKFKGKKIVFHCRIGNRSLKACETIAKLHPDYNIYSLEGGIEAWKAANFPYEKGKVAASSSCCGFFTKLSLENQSRVVFGSMIVVFILLGYYVNPAFFWITGVAGAILVATGFTDMCMIRSSLAYFEYGHGAPTSGSMPTPTKAVTASTKARKKSTKKPIKKKKRK